jgi:hypothetical protein
MKLFHGADGIGSESSTLNENSDPWLDLARDKSSFEIVEVDTLSSILDREGFDSNIGILKVDAESWDYFVLMGLDFSRHTPKVIVTEEYLWDVDLTISKHLLLEGNSYVNLGFVGYNSIWVHASCGARWSYKSLGKWLTSIGVVYPIMGPESLLNDIEKLTSKSRVKGPIDLASYKLALAISGLPRFSISSASVLRSVLANFGVGNLPSLPLENGRKGLFLSYHWKTAKGKDVVWEGVRTPLPKDLLAGDSMLLDIEVVAPDKLGKYVLYIDLMQEEVGWYSDSNRKLIEPLFIYVGK